MEVNIRVSVCLMGCNFKFTGTLIFISAIAGNGTLATAYFFQLSIIFFSLVLSLNLVLLFFNSVLLLNLVLKSALARHTPILRAVTLQLKLNSMV